MTNQPRSERLELLDVLAAGDGQEWPHFWESVEQRQIAETMYGRQADAVLASTWLAVRLDAEVVRLRADLEAWERKAADLAKVADHSARCAVEARAERDALQAALDVERSYADAAHAQALDFANRAFAAERERDAAVAALREVRKLANEAALGHNVVTVEALAAVLSGSTRSEETSHAD